MTRPVDYALVYRLEDARYEAERRYICPFRDWVMDFADHFRKEPWWGRIPDGHWRGSWFEDDGHYDCGNERHGEIPWR